MSSPKRPISPQDAALAAMAVYAAHTLAQRIACAQALRDGRRPVTGALNNTHADNAEQEDAYQN